MQLPVESYLPQHNRFIFIKTLFWHILAACMIESYKFYSWWPLARNICTWPTQLLCVAISTVSFSIHIFITYVCVYTHVTISALLDLEFPLWPPFQDVSTKRGEKPEFLVHHLAQSVAQKGHCVFFMSRIKQGRACLVQLPVIFQSSP